MTRPEPDPHEEFLPVVPTRYWHALGDGRIQCDLCPRFCKLHEGQRGLCFVRACREHRIVLTTYGRSSGFCIDPIEKKPLYHFLPGSAVLSFGTAGCNLACRFCQNWDISKSRDLATLADAATPDRIALAASDLGCRSVAFTYNDPVIFHEYAIDVADACRARGIRTVAITAGYVCPEPRDEFYRHIDAANVDLKSIREEFYAQLCSGQLQPVLDTLIAIRAGGRVWLEITNLLIPGWNDTDEEIEALTRWVFRELGSDVPLHFSAYRPAWRMLNVPATPPATLRRARRIAVANGLRFVYSGPQDPEGESTSCRRCGVPIIGRRRCEVIEWNLDDAGRCRACGTITPGLFEGPPGEWGARCLPVDVTSAHNRPTTTG